MIDPTTRKILGVPDSVDELDYYVLLNLGPKGITKESIEAACKRRAAQLKPFSKDPTYRSLVTSLARQIMKAAEALKDPAERRLYDKVRAGGSGELPAEKPRGGPKRRSDPMVDIADLAAAADEFSAEAVGEGPPLPLPVGRPRSSRLHPRPTRRQWGMKPHTPVLVSIVIALCGISLIVSLVLVATAK